MTHDEMIAVITAHKEGKTIQFRWRSEIKWQDTACPAWNFGDHDYRVKPEPLEIWVNVYSDGTIGGDMSGKKEMCAMSCGYGGRTVKFREVLDEN